MCVSKHCVFGLMFVCFYYLVALSFLWLVNFGNDNKNKDNEAGRDMNGRETILEFTQAIDVIRDLAVLLLSFGETRWLTNALRSLPHQGHGKQEHCARASRS